MRNDKSYRVFYKDKEEDEWEPYLGNYSRRTVRHTLSGVKSSIKENKKYYTTRQYKIVEYKLVETGRILYE